MDRSASPLRPEPERSLTWPHTLLFPATGDAPKPKSKRTVIDKRIHGDPSYGFFEEDLENHPEYHFLSPIKMYEYEYWAVDSDEDGEEVEWDAGITDFALFDDDRRRAQESNQPLPSKWSGMLEQQTSALQRAVQRNRANSDPYPVTGTLSTSDDEPPSLTPDVSPDLRDDLDVESYHGQTVSRSSVPNYLTITVTPPNDEGNDNGEDDDLPLSFFVARKRATSPNRKLQRPGLRHSRTMSGRAHTWVRPSMHTVGEDAKGEERAERKVDRSEDEKNENEESRGRRR